MAALAKSNSCNGKENTAFEFEAEQCSVCGRRSPNEDYALFEKNVGVCVADGIGGAPLGDAIARYACHVAMDILREGGTARDAVKGAGERVHRFVTSVDSQSSGASIVVARLDGDTLDASWAGDAALFLQDQKANIPSVTSTLESGQPGSETPLCGDQQVRPGSLSKTVTDGETILLCTDGVWRHADRETISRFVLGDGSLREAAARLVLGQQPEDDSTVVVARVHADSLATRMLSKGA